MRTIVNVPEQTEEDKDSRILKGMTVTIEAEDGDSDATLLFIAHARIRQLEDAARIVVKAAARFETESVALHELMTEVDALEAMLPPPPTDD